MFTHGLPCLEIKPFQLLAILFVHLSTITHMMTLQNVCWFMFFSRILILLTIFGRIHSRFTFMKCLRKQNILSIVFLWSRTTESNDCIKLLQEKIQNLNNCLCKFSVLLKSNNIYQFTTFENLKHKFQLLFSNNSEAERVWKFWVQSTAKITSLNIH